MIRDYIEARVVFPDIKISLVTNRSISQAVGDHGGGLTTHREGSKTTSTGRVVHETGAGTDEVIVGKRDLTV